MGKILDTIKKFSNSEEEVYQLAQMARLSMYLFNSHGLSEEEAVERANDRLGTDSFWNEYMINCLTWDEEELEEFAYSVLGDNLPKGVHYYAF